MSAREPNTTTRAVAFQDVGLTSLAGEPIVRGVSWELRAGGVGSVIGPSGSGKSRLLRLLNRLDDATSGRVEVLGRDVCGWAPRELRRAVGWVPQAPTLGAGTGGANVELPYELGLVSRAELADRLAEARGVAGVTDEIAGRSATVLSGGERYRVALARALVLAPTILALDEPTGSLDGAGGAALLAALAQWQADRAATLVVVTHRLADVRALGGELLMLERGQVAASGAVADLLAGDSGERIRALMAGDAA